MMSLHRSTRALLLAFAAINDCTAIRLHNVPLDGNCLFSAVALSAALVDYQPAQARARAVRTAAARLRAEALDLLCPRGEPDPDLMFGELPAELVIEPIGHESTAEYCLRMRRDGEWGSVAEVLALTRVLNRPIHVFKSFGPMGEAEIYGEHERLRPLSIFYDSGANHYQAVTVDDLDKSKVEL